jgi:hypothetical protein
VLFRINNSMNCTNCNVTLEDVLTKQQLNNKIRARRINPNCNIFCSQSCGTTFNNLNKKTGKAKAGIKKKCKVTGCDNFIPRHGKQFCIECRIEKDKALTYLTNPTKSELQYSIRSSPYSYIRYHARQVVAKDWIKECYNCKYSKHVELAHIKGIAEFSNESRINEINEPSNLMFLCPNCHWEFDRGRLELPNK